MQRVMGAREELEKECKTVKGAIVFRELKLFSDERDSIHRDSTANAIVSIQEDADLKVHCGFRDC